MKILSKIKSFFKKKKKNKKNVNENKFVQTENQDIVNETETINIFKDDILNSELLNEIINKNDSKEGELFIEITPYSVSQTHNLKWNEIYNNSLKKYFNANNASIELINEIMNNPNTNEVLFNEIFLFVKDKLKKSSGLRDDYLPCFKNARKVIKEKEKIKNRKYLIFVANSVTPISLKNIFNELRKNKKDFVFNLTVLELIINNENISIDLLTDILNYTITDLRSIKKQAKILSFIINSKKSNLVLREKINQYLRENIKIINEIFKLSNNNLCNFCEYDENVFSECNFSEKKLNDFIIPYNDKNYSNIDELSKCFANVECEKGHYYISADNSECPYCKSRKGTFIDLNKNYENYIIIQNNWSAHFNAKSVNKPTDTILSLNIQTEENTESFLSQRTSGTIYITNSLYIDNEGITDFFIQSISCSQSKLLRLDLYIFQKPGIWKKEKKYKEINLSITQKHYSEINIYINNQFIKKIDKIIYSY